MAKCLFVSSQCYLGQGGGGVQWCTREYLSCLSEGGLLASVVATSPPQDLLSKMSRRFLYKPYRALHSRKVLSEILNKTSEFPGWVFLNNTDAASLAPRLRSLRPDVRLCFLSHGVEITDIVNNLRLAPEATVPAHHSSRWLGDMLKAEVSVRQALDAVVCISEQDVVFENWLGSANVLFLPRQVPALPLMMRPVIGRVGTVGTLSHGPNLHGLRMFASRLNKSDGLTIRLVGGPAEIGRSLESEFECIEYLGQLCDDSLRAEAATWRAFVNPIFCYARGASTKVATALGWGVPVVTTLHGARGYVWDQQSLPLAASVDEMVTICRQISCLDDFKTWHDRAMRIAQMAPTAAEAGCNLVEFLNRCVGR